MLLQTDPSLTNATVALVVVTILLVITAGISALLVRSELKLTREEYRAARVAAWPETFGPQPELMGADAWIGLLWTRTDGTRAHLSWVMRDTPAGWRREWADR